MRTMMEELPRTNDGTIITDGACAGMPDHDGSGQPDIDREKWHRDSGGGEQGGYDSGWVAMVK